MQVSERVLLKCRDGPEVVLPPTLVQEDDQGQKWVKLRPSHFSIVKLLLGHIPEFKDTKNPTLANCQKFAELQSMVKAELKKALGLPEGSGDDVFEDTDAAAGGSKLDKALLETAPPHVTVALQGVDVMLKTPATLKESDVCVLLQEDQLTAVCSWILEGISAIAPPKRKYEKSGNFSKVKKAK